MNAMEWARIVASVLGVAMIGFSLWKMLRIQKIWNKSGRGSLGGHMFVALVEVMAPKAFTNPGLATDARMLLSASAMALFSWAGIVIWLIPECTAWAAWALGQSPARGMMLPNVLTTLGWNADQADPFVHALFVTASASVELFVPSFAVGMANRCDMRLRMLRELRTPMGDGFAKAYELDVGRRESLACAKDIEKALGQATDLNGSSSSKRL